MDLDNYRSSLDYREILRILQKASALQDNFLWQTHAVGRSVIPIQHFEIDFVTREVVVYFDDRRFPLDMDLNLYVKLDYRMSVFKMTKFHPALGCVHFSFPLEIKTQEFRTNPRHQFQPKSDKIVTLRPSLSGTRDTSHELHVRAIDISKQGIGVLISEQNRPFLKNNRILWVTKLGEEILEYPLLCEVVYISKKAA
jgi:hypothetical protein